MDRFSEKIPFASWSPRMVPAVAAGVYAIWHDDTLIYCGMSGRGFDPVKIAGKSRYGLVTRLDSHASGRLSGDQFCVYVANRLVIPSLRPEQLPLFIDGELSLDSLTKEYIHEHLAFQFAITETGVDAFALEADCRRGKVFGVRPLLNPLQ
jgi:hypothetical protein